MAQYTLIIDDQEGGVTVKLNGPAGTSPANYLAQSLQTIAPHLLQLLVARRLMTSDCKCKRCESARSTKSTAKPTLH